MDMANLGLAPTGTGPATGGLPGELPATSIDPTGAVSSSGGYNTVAVLDPTANSPAGEPVAVLDQGSTGWAEQLTPGGQQALLGGGYSYGDDQGLPYYGDYANWDCPTCHPGTDIITDGSQPFTALTSGTVIAAGGTGYYEDETGGIGELTIQTDDGAIITYGHTNSTPLAVGDEVTLGEEIGMSGFAGDAWHVHAEVKLPIGPDGSLVPVDPAMYYSGEYCSQGYCPDGVQQGQAAPQQAGGLAPYTSQPVSNYAAPAAAPATYTTDSQSYSSAPAQQQSLPPPSSYDAGYSTPAPGQVTTDSSGRQYEERPDGTLRLIYDPSW
jgi:hypothetical protein